MIEIEKGSANVYEDLGLPDAEEIQVKASLAAKIGEIIKHRHLTQVQASEVLGMPQPKQTVGNVAWSVPWHQRGQDARVPESAGSGRRDRGAQAIPFPHRWAYQCCFRQIDSSSGQSGQGGRRSQHVKKTAIR